MTNSIKHVKINFYNNIFSTIVRKRNTQLEVMLYFSNTFMKLLMNVLYYLIKLS